jgi:hypothetical protein
MEGRFEFDGGAVRALVEASHAAAERRMTEAQRYIASGIDLRAGDPADSPEAEHPGTGAPPGLWLMNDRGVYLRSNAADRDGERVAHAAGYVGEVQVGDEPICEFIDAGPLDQLRDGDTLVVTLSDERVRLSLLRDG